MLPSLSYKWLGVSYSTEKIRRILETKEGRGESIKTGGGKTRSILTDNEIDKIREITKEITKEVELLKR
ncbi:MAG: hypothetical protein WBM86_25540 [Waterburya sp.]